MRAYAENRVWLGVGGILTILAGWQLYCTVDRGPVDPEMAAKAVAPVESADQPIEPVVQEVEAVRAPDPTTVADENGYLTRYVPYVPMMAAKTRWIRFDVMPNETIEEIAQQFEIEVDDIIEWNRLSPKRLKLRPGQKLRIFTSKAYTPRLHVRYRVQKDDSWQSVAENYGVDLDTLKRFNPRYRSRRLRAKTIVHLWVKSALPKYDQIRTLYTSSLAENAEVEFPTFDVKVRPGGESVGYPTWGRLRNGVQLPQSSLYDLRIPDEAYGSTYTIETIQRSIASFRYETGFSGEVLVSGISKPRGGKYPPHQSHQSGRDVDIWLPSFPGFPEGIRVTGAKVDWGATWALIESFLRTERVQYIFIAYGLQRRLHDTARVMGASEEELRKYFQWPRGKSSQHGLIRHSPGHWGHFHVRIKCGPNEPKCKGDPSNEEIEPVEEKIAQNL